MNDTVAVRKEISASRLLIAEQFPAVIWKVEGEVGDKVAASCFSSTDSHHSSTDRVCDHCQGMMSCQRSQTLTVAL